MHDQREQPYVAGNQVHVEAVTARGKRVDADKHKVVDNEAEGQGGG